MKTIELIAVNNSRHVIFVDKIVRVFNNESGNKTYISMLGQDNIIATHNTIDEIMELING